MELDELNIYLLVIKFSNEGTFCIIFCFCGTCITLIIMPVQSWYSKTRLSESFIEIHKTYMVNRYLESVYFKLNVMCSLSHSDG